MEVSHHVKTINKFPFSTVWNSHQQDSNFVSHLQSIVLGENQSFKFIILECTFGNTFIFTRVQKPMCPTISKLLSASDPPRSGIVLNERITSYHNCSQFSWAKTRASTLYNKRVPSWLLSPAQECKNQAKTEVSYHVKHINSFRSSTVCDSHKQDSNLVPHLQAIASGENQSFNST